MKLANSILSFLFGIWILYAIITACLMVKDNLEDLSWDSLEPYAILFALLFIGFYSLINILVPFQKKEMKKSGRILMITLHNIILLVILIFSFNQYTFMNPINIVINILMLVTIVYLIAYHIIKLK
jgi:hypothetical protein